MFSALDGVDPLIANPPNQNDLLTDVIGGGEMLGIPSLEKNFAISSPFASLAANAESIPMSSLNFLIGSAYRNSFDFIEMDSQNLWEMTGDSYKKLVNQSMFTQCCPILGGNASKPQVPFFPVETSN